MDPIELSAKPVPLATPVPAELLADAAASEPLRQAGIGGYSDDGSDEAAAPIDELAGLVDLARVDLKPGDTIVVMMEERLIPMQYGMLKDRLAEQFPGHPVVFLPPGVRIGIVGKEA